MTRTLRFLFVLTVQGCGFPLDAGSGDAGTQSMPTASATASPPESVCAKPSGMYLATYQERSGTCGPLADEVATFEGQPAKPASPCTSGEYRYSADNCEVTTVDVTCPSLSGQGSTVWNGKYVWNVKATEAAGTLALDLDDGSFTCQSSYNVVLERL